MTEDVANAIMDWLDADDEVREPNSAESSTTAALPTPYEPTNGPIQSVEELLLVQGVTPTLLFGADTNRNGLLDADEQQRFNVSIDTAGSAWLGGLPDGSQRRSQQDATMAHCESTSTKMTWNCWPRNSRNWVMMTTPALSLRIASPVNQHRGCS